MDSDLQIFLGKKTVRWGRSDAPDGSGAMVPMGLVRWSDGSSPMVRCYGVRWSWLDVFFFFFLNFWRWVRCSFGWNFFLGFGPIHDDEGVTGEGPTRWRGGLGRVVGGGEGVMARWCVGV